MSTPNPEQPAPTPRTDACLHEYEHQNDLTCFDDMPYPTELLKLARQLERELNAAKQPVPDAGVREKVRHLLQDMLTVPLSVSYTADRILALFPAPTPATSEDTRLLDWLEDNAATLSHERGAGRYPWQVNWWTGTRKELVHRNTCEPTARQALRAARATTKGAE